MVKANTLPKQWVITRQNDTVDLWENGQKTAFGDWCVDTAPYVPVTTLETGGTARALIIGWPIIGEDLIRENTTRDLADQSIEDYYRDLGGRFVLLWQDGEQVYLREDSAGSLPAVYSADLARIASTVTALDPENRLAPNIHANAIFEFPKRRGFLPFGLTSRENAHRLLPGQRLCLGDFTTQRIWPCGGLKRRADGADVTDLVDESVAIMTRHLRAILAQGETVLYLSGGHDSRIAMAATRGDVQKLRAETIDNAGEPDAHIAANLSRYIGIDHRVLSILPVSQDAVTNWLARAGYSVYDHVTHLTKTMQQADPGTHPIAGTGAELTRASNWSGEDIGQSARDVTIEKLLGVLRIPETERVQKEAQKWMDGLGDLDQFGAPALFDLAKIEQIHACWSGAEVYGNPLAIPTINPFSSQRLNDITMQFPDRYRLENGFYHDFVSRTWPDLFEIPINRVTGVARLKFWKQEIKNLIPKSVKHAIKPYR